MNEKYTIVLNEIVDEVISDLDERERIKEIIKCLIQSESEYEFNEERPRIKSLLDSLID